VTLGVRRVYLSAQGFAGGLVDFERAIDAAENPVAPL
jgi:hypothetical protein